MRYSPVRAPRQPQSIGKSKKPSLGQFSILSAPAHNSSQKVDDQISNIYESSRDSEVETWEKQRSRVGRLRLGNLFFIWSENFRYIPKGVKRWKKEGSKPSYCFNLTCKSLGFYILLFYLKYKTVLFAEIVLTLFWCKISFYDCVAFIPGPQ